MGVEACYYRYPMHRELDATYAPGTGGSTVQHTDTGRIEARMDWLTIALSLALLGGIVLLVFALRDIITTPTLNDMSRLLWIVIVLAAPILGTLIWFLVGRNRVGSLDRR